MFADSGIRKSNDWWLNRLRILSLLYGKSLIPGPGIHMSMVQPKEKKINKTSNDMKRYTVECCSLYSSSTQLVACPQPPREPTVWFLSDSFQGFFL